MSDEVLAQASLFAALDDQAAAALRSTMAEVSLPRGAVLFNEGEPGDRLYVISEGKVKLGTTSTDGRETLLAILGPGEMFGELRFRPGPSDLDRDRADEDEAGRRRSRRPRALAEGPPGGRGRAAPSSGTPASPKQRDVVRSRVQRRSRSGGQSAARSRAQIRRDQSGRQRARGPRPDPGRAGPARRSLKRDREQSAGRLPEPRLAAHRATRRRASRPRSPQSPRALKRRSKAAAAPLEAA